MNNKKQLLKTSRNQTSMLTGFYEFQEGFFFYVIAKIDHRIANNNCFLQEFKIWFRKEVIFKQGGYKYLATSNLAYFGDSINKSQ